MLQTTASGSARKYAPAHAGWVGITSYTDQDGVLRIKTETLVASSSITAMLMMTYNYQIVIKTYDLI